MAIDVAKVKAEAQKELDEERNGEAKKRMKAKLRELKTAEQVVANIKREIEDLEEELADTE